MAAIKRSMRVRRVFKSSCAARAPATAEAALPPMPAASGRPFSTCSSRPASRSRPARLITAAAPSAAVLRKGSVGMRSSETATTRTPGPFVRAARTVSPRPVNAMPKQSNPGPMLDAVPGA